MAGRASAHSFSARPSGCERMKRFLLAVASIVVSFVADAGQLRIRDEAPRQYTCGDRVEPADVARPYTLADDVDPIYTLGTLAAGESSIACRGLGTLDLRISAKRVSRQDHTRVSIGNATATWQLSIPERQLAKKIAVNLPRGTYELSIERRRAIRIHKTVVIGDTTAKVAADLEPLPQLSGVVLARSTGRPVAGALISTNVANGEVDQSAITDAEGRFSIDADPDRWPAKVIVRAIPFAETSAVVPAARASTTLPEIYVSRGGTVAVEIQQNEPRRVMEVELLPLVRNSTTEKPVSTLPVPAGHPTASIRFENVEPGPYVVLAKGDRPLERHGTVVEVIEGQEVSLAIAIQPFALRIGTKVDGETLLEAAIRFSNLDGYWESPIIITGGHADVELWQGGRVRSMVSATGFSAPHIARRKLPEENDEWIIDVPAREITGRVIDSQTSEPVAGAALSLHVHESGSSFSVRTKADGNGRFRLFPVPHGTHTLKVAGAGYPPAEMTYRFFDPEQNRDLMVRLDRAATVAVTIVDHAGAPLALALVMQFKDGMRLQAHTDWSGKVDLPLPASGKVDVYVLPRDGSFAIAALDADMKETVIRVPPGAARIVLRAETEERAPIPSVPILARYNGRVIPPDVFDALAGTRGGRIANTDGRVVLAHMPVGLYEFWPVASTAQREAVQAGRGSEPRVKLTAAPGENVAVMTLAPLTRD